MNQFSSVGNEGQVTIPHEVRLQLGLREGDRVEFVVEGDCTVIRPVRLTDNPFDRYVGVLGTFPGGAQEIKAWVRDVREEAQEPGNGL